MHRVGFVFEYCLNLSVSSEHPGHILLVFKDLETENAYAKKVNGFKQAQRSLLASDISHDLVSLLLAIRQKKHVNYSDTKGL
jgi:hypothetical protein